MRTEALSWWDNQPPAWHNSIGDKKAIIPLETQKRFAKTSREIKQHQAEWLAVRRAAPFHLSSRNGKCIRPQCKNCGKQTYDKCILRSRARVNLKQPNIQPNIHLGGTVVDEAVQVSAPNSGCLSFKFLRGMTKTDVVSTEPSSLTVAFP
ncbi:hypothetical protein Y032_0007g3415 [Ancylostoma ceylanicum]|uniref:Uncharacterized protein n=1 Tax=Ancylostoma ceylanicum TaxID=53326 RepID=A0A016VN71_9BILA|nr:hypothetical protein Y032_0007g3415 [Ancylostoma ceylanicum]